MKARRAPGRCSCRAGPHGARGDRRLIQFAPYWDAGHDTGSSRLRHASDRRADGWQELVSSVLAVALGLAGILVAWAFYSSAGSQVPRLPALQRVLEHKFYFDELYDARLLPAGRARSQPGCAATSRSPSILASGPDLGETALDTGRLVRRLQTGPAAHLRPLPRHRAWPSSPSSSSSCDDDLRLHLAPHLAADRRRDPGLDPSALALRRPARSRARLAPRGRHLDRAGSRTSTSTRNGIQFEQRASWIKDLGVSYHVGEYGFSLWLVGLTVIAMAACVGYGFWVGRERPRAYFGLDALPDGRDGRRLRRAGPAPLLRVLRGDADPALRADRRLGRRRAGSVRR